ncbi:MAG: NAD-dependent epimerase/dehydratase family protein, partial [Elusimicrobiota bacterium]
MKRILVTGGAGAIGSNLVAALSREQGASVTVLDDGSSGRFASVPKPARLVRGDVADGKLLDRVLREPFAEIYHLAAFFANQNSCDHPLDDFRTNALGTVLLLEKALRLKSLKVLLFASTSSLKGDLDAGLAEGFSPPYMAS